MKESIIELLEQNRFVPHPALRNAHAQTIAGTFIPRRVRLLSGNSRPRIFEVAPHVRLLARCSWQPDKLSRPTLLVVHGLEGSADSHYMLGTAEKALAAGFNVIRLNLRNCGGTEHLSSLLYHAGLTDDLRSVIKELIEEDRLSELYLAGFSLGGNMALKLAGENGADSPAALRGVIAVSPSLDLASCADAIELRSNLIYHLSFLWSLKDTLRRKAKLHPDRYDASGLRRIRSIRMFDDTYTAPLSGFRDVADYYKRASAIAFIPRITVPTLIIHSKDDPFIPFAPFLSTEITGNANVKLLASDFGGHVGFISARLEGDDRFWAERKIIECVRLLSEQR